MSDSLTLETFVPHISTTFDLALNPEEIIHLRLYEVKPLGHGVPGGREPFALLFTHPHLPKNAYLPQSTYPLNHPTLGLLELFLVPLGPDAQGMRYEAIFT